MPRPAVAALLARFFLLFLLCPSALLPGTAQAHRQDQRLTPGAWTLAPGSPVSANWDSGGVTLTLKRDLSGAGQLQAAAPLSGDFIAEVSFELLGWQGGIGQTTAMGFGLTTTEKTLPEKQQTVALGREWAGTFDQYRAATVRGTQTYLRAGSLSAEKTGRLRLISRGGLVHAAFQVGPGWDTLQLFTLSRNEPLRLFFYIENRGEGSVRFPEVQVRFFDLKVQTLPSLKGGSRGATNADPTQGGWVVYATAPGWLRVGSQQELARPQKQSDEIFGGNGDDALVKIPLEVGFANRAEAIGYLCERLTKVVVKSFPTSQPHEIVRGIFNGKEYYLRLTGADDPEALTRAEGYDLAAEKAALKEHGITPRMGFGKQWLVHITGHGTVDGDVRDDAWVLFNREPQADPANPAVGSIVTSDGFGGTIGYRCDQWEGPYRDNYGLARALKRRNVGEIALYPPGNSYTPRVVVADVPENPRDFGSEVLGVQPITDAPELSDWVVYLTGGVWLHVGTRAEFEYPVKSRETLWAGPGDEVMQRESVPLSATFNSYEQAMEALVGKLVNVHAAYHPSAEPRETLVADLGGRPVHLNLVRDPDIVIGGYGNYNYGAESALLQRYGKAPSKRFQKQWLVHANSVGTSNGPQKRDLWMMVNTEPKNNRIELSDGMGGTFGFTLDAVEGPFQESGPLAAALKAKGLKSIRLYAEDREVAAAEAAKPTASGPAEKPEILSITPDRGEPGQTLYITIVATGMKPGYRFRFGPGVMVTQETSLGKNPDGPGERWLATITIDKDTTFRAGQE